MHIVITLCDDTEKVLVAYDAPFAPRIGEFVNIDTHDYLVKKIVHVFTHVTGMITYVRVQ